RGEPRKRRTSKTQPRRGTILRATDSPTHGEDVVAPSQPRVEAPPRRVATTHARSRRSHGEAPPAPASTQRGSRATARQGPLPAHPPPPARPPTDLPRSAPPHPP